GGVRAGGDGGADRAVAGGGGGRCRPKLLGTRRVRHRGGCERRAGPGGARAWGPAAGRRGLRKRFQHHGSAGLARGGTHRATLANGVFPAALTVRGTGDITPIPSNSLADGGRWTWQWPVGSAGPPDVYGIPGF